MIHSHKKNIVVQWKECQLVTKNRFQYLGVHDSVTHFLKQKRFTILCYINLC